MEDLEVLESTGRKGGEGYSQIPGWNEIVTPLQVKEWRASLCSHPDDDFCSYIIRGITNGFIIGFDHQGRRNPAKSNMLSVLQNPGVIDDYLRAKIEEGCILGPVTQVSGVHINRFGVIPKQHQVGRWRLIVDLSHPEGTSINDGIPSERCSLKYPTVDDAIRIIKHLGRGTQLAKWDCGGLLELVITWEVGTKETFLEHY